MEERPLVEVGLDALRHILETYSPGRSKPKSFAAIAGLVARLERELPDSEVRVCLTGFSEDVDSTEFAIRIERVGPSRRWKAVDTESKAFHVNERRAVRLWLELRIEGRDDLQYCTDRKRRSPWRKADETGIEALLAEAKGLWKGLEAPDGADGSWRSDTVALVFG